MNQSNNENDYVVIFKGAKLTRREAKRVGVSAIWGLSGALGCLVLFGPEMKFLNLLIVFSLTAFGYFRAGKLPKK